MAVSFTKSSRYRNGRYTNFWDAIHTDINDGGQTVKLVTPEEGTPSKGTTPATGLPKTGDELPWVAILCAVGAAGCCAGVIALSKRRKGLDEAEDDADEVEEPRTRS